MSEVEMTEFQKKLLGKLEMQNEWISRLVAYLEAKNPDIEMINNPQDVPTIVVTEETSMTWEMKYEEKNYKKFTPCKYKCGFWTGWGKPYNEGDKKLHINPGTKKIIGFQCPKYAEEGK